MSPLNRIHISKDVACQSGGKSAKTFGGKIVALSLLDMSEFSDCQRQSRREICLKIEKIGGFSKYRCIPQERSPSHLTKRCN